jgi:hypothetical protein
MKPRGTLAPALTIRGLRRRLRGALLTRSFAGTASACAVRRVGSLTTHRSGSRILAAGISLH